MRKIINYLGIVLLLAGSFSCKKEGDIFNLKEGAFVGNALQSSTEELVLSTDNDNSDVLSFNWSDADFGRDPIVTYTLELATAADTANNWSNAKRFVLPYASNKQYIFKGKDLNGLLNEMGLPADQPNTIAVRVKAELRQYNGAESPMKASYSNTTILQITSYGLSLYVPGDYQGWSPGTAPSLAPVAGQPGKYHGYVYMSAPGLHYFKYTNAPDWGHTNYGDGGNGSFSTDGMAGGLSVPDGGYYYLTADLNANKWTATKTVWGIIGDASPGSWDNSTEMTYDEDSQTWWASLVMKQAGSWKFRANNNWALNMGIDGQGGLQYADNVFLGYVERGNMNISEDGNYTIRLDLHVPGKQTYTVTKN